MSDKTCLRLALLVDILHFVVIGILIFPASEIPGIPEWLVKLDVLVSWVTLASQIIFLGCPLVLISEGLRVKAGKERLFGGSFTAFFVRRLFGIDLPKSAGFAIVVIVCLFGILSFFV